MQGMIPPIPFLMNIVSSFLYFGLSILVFYRYRQSKIGILLLLFLSFLLLGFSNLFSFLTVNRAVGFEQGPNPSNFLTFTLLGGTILHNILQSAGLFVLILFLDLFKNETISPKRTGFFAIIFGYLMAYPFTYSLFILLNSSDYSFSLIPLF